MPLDQRYIDQSQAYIREAIRSENPTAEVDGGSAINVLFARGASAIVAPVLAQLEQTAARRDLTDLDSLSDDDFKLLIDNTLTDFDSGSFSRGFINVYYANRSQKTLPAGWSALTQDGTKTYVTTVDLVFKPEDHLLDTSLNQYYIIVPMRADTSGSDYDVDVGEISKTGNDTTGALSVINKAKFRDGAEENSPAEILALAQRATSVRTILTEDGAIYAAQKLLGQKLLDILVIGNGDPEMLRDILHDMGASSTPRFKIGREALGGESLGFHVGGREDIYTWFRNVNLVQTVVDIFADMGLTNAAAIGATQIVADIVPGTSGTVEDTGKIILDVGTPSEESSRYSAYTSSGATYNFTLLDPLLFSHGVGAAVRAANTGRIKFSADGRVTTLPLLRMFDVRTLDPVTLAPIGDPIPETTVESTVPGWRIEGRHSADSLSAKEELYLILDEKHDFVGSEGIVSADGITAQVSGFTELTSPSKDFTGYQGRSIKITVGPVVFTRNITAIKNAGTTVVLDGDSSLIASGSNRVFSIEENIGDFTQYPIRITFYTHTEIQQLQELLSSSDQRIVTTNTTVRAFLPVFIDFTLRYKGDGSTSNVRKQLLSVIQTSAGTIPGQNEGASFDFSDLVNAPYGNSLAAYVETPFQVRCTYMNADGSQTVRYLNPDANTVNQLAIAVATGIGDSVIKTIRPASVPAFSVPKTGKLRIGGFSLVPNVVVEYVRVIESGTSQSFILKEGQTIDSVRPTGESVTVHVSDYDPDLVITDGTITSGRNQRPYFGEVTTEKIS